MAERTQKTNVTWPRRPPQEAGWLLEKPELWGSEPMGRAEKASRRKAGSKARAEVDSAVSMRQRGGKGLGEGRRDQRWKDAEERGTVLGRERMLT